MADTNELKNVLDRIEGVVWPASLTERFHNDLEKRATLWAGLEFLYGYLKKLEDGLGTESKPGIVEIAWGNVPGVPVPVLRQISCFFDWYSVSASSFVLLTGWLMEQGGQLSERGRYQYRRNVIPDVTVHRNKIGAHPSRFDPKNDGRALQEASCIRNIGLVNGRWHANSMVFGRRDNSGVSDSGVLNEWSLTSTHESLRGRYAASKSTMQGDMRPEE